MPKSNHRDHLRRVRKAAEDPQLRTAMERAVESYSAARADGLAPVDFEALSDQVRALKERAIEDLPALIARFRQEAERVGATVYEAKTAEDARRYIVDLARQHGVTLAVKSKSMATDEIELNAALEAAGVRAVETDLGEWIVQLAGERPSHMVSPAMHKTREQVAALLSRVTGRTIEPDIPDLVAVARAELRRCFVEAQMGITGANIAIAESGTLVLVTNEGNGRLVSSLPPIHVALVGIEKVVPTIDDAVAILKLLARNSTGQTLTSYTTFITGPSRSSDIEKTPVLGVHGPQQLHIVLLDNGRSELRADPEFREALYCIRCGACMYLCQPFQAVTGHVFGHVYTGAIGAILTAWHHGIEHAEEPLALCQGCRYCVEVCPAQIDTPRMVLRLRERIVADGGLPPANRAVLRGLLRRPERLRAAARAATWGQRIIWPGKRSLDHLPLIGREHTEWRALPTLARAPLRDRWRDDAAGPAGRVAFFAGCLIDLIYPEIGESVATALRANGYQVSLPPGQACCGIPAIYHGDRETAEALARRNIAALEAADPDLIITACPTCGVALREDFVRLTAGDRRWESRGRRIAEITRDFSEFMADVIAAPAAGIGAGAALRVTYHDPCHLRRGLGISDQPRALVRAAGHELVEMADCDRCCGFAGDYSLAFPPISRRVLEHKLDQVEAAGPAVVATDCPGCIIQIRGGLQQRGSGIEVVHTACLLTMGQS
jgi:iron-sulfur cluster protein